jgi:hypothetical protein
MRARPSMEATSMTAPDALRAAAEKLVDGMFLLPEVNQAFVNRIYKALLAARAEGREEVAILVDRIANKMPAVYHAGMHEVVRAIRALPAPPVASEEPRR